MSIWTQVLGTIRFDGMKGITPKPDLGELCGWKDTDKQCNIPCGSEGSLTLSVWENEDECSASRYTVTIFGSLRDYDKGQEIIDYFNRIVKNHMIRQACFTFCINSEKERVFIWKQHKKVFEETS